MIKTSAVLLEDLSDYRDPFGKIKRLCREQKLFPVSRGIYETKLEKEEIEKPKL